jgi:hypothetical protein
MHSMSEEDREHFKEQMRKRCGWGKSGWDWNDKPETQESKTE